MKTNITVVKEFTFDAAHRLPNYLGKCVNLHGHTYKLQVGFRRTVILETGMVVDFNDLSAIVKAEVVQPLDHAYLNEVTLDGFPRETPTAENMIIWIIGRLCAATARLAPFVGADLVLVRLWETPTSYAEWVPEHE